jgi:hypothetical protein
MTPQGEDHRAPGREFPLCPRNMDALSWWLGFIGNILESYPNLTGIDLAEPVVSWEAGKACYCDKCIQSFETSLLSPEESRAQPLTFLLGQTIHTVRKTGKKVSLTFVAGSHRSGKLKSQEEMMRQTGFDLAGILSLPLENRPDILCPKFIWQEWASRYPENGDIFSPEWSAAAYSEFISGLDVPIDVLPHIEITDFSHVQVSREHLSISLRSLLQAGADGFDISSSSQLDRKDAWPALLGLEQCFKNQSCLVLYDPGDNRNDAIQIGELIRHFHTDVNIQPLDEYCRGLINQYDHVFYAGSIKGSPIPAMLSEDLLDLRSTFCWLGFNLDQALQLPVLAEKLGVVFEETTEDRFDQVIYKGFSLPKKNPWTEVFSISNPFSCQVLAEAVSSDGDRKIPYAVRCGRRFWPWSGLKISILWSIRMILKISLILFTAAASRFKSQSSPSMSILRKTFGSPFRIARMWY